MLVNLCQYILEQELEDLKTQIKKNVDKTNNEELLTKINNYFDLSETEYNDVNEYFSKRCGYNEKISSTLRQKIKHYGFYKLFGELFKSIKNNNKNIKYFTSESLINGSNIFDEIKNFALSVLENSKNKNKTNNISANFEKLLKDIANFDIGGKVATGKMEFLSSMFLNDLNPSNNPGETKCDINTEKYGFEYKTSGARITGNNEQAKPLSPEEINKTFINLIYLHFIDDSKETDTQKNKNQYSSTIRLNKDLEKELEKAEIEKTLRDYIEKLYKTENIFRNAKGNEIEKILNPIFEFNITEEKLNSIIITSLLAQVPNLNITSKEFNYLLKTYPIADNKQITENGKANFKHIFLLLGLCNYWSAEKWNYLILFEKPDKKECTGNYKVIKQPDKSNLIISMDNNIHDENNNLKCYSGAYPCYGPGTNNQNHAPMIKYKK